jgi:hypothetical protein
MSQAGGDKKGHNWKGEKNADNRGNRSCSSRRKIEAGGAVERQAPARTLDEPSRTACSRVRSIGRNNRSRPANAEETPLNPARAIASSARSE